MSETAQAMFSDGAAYERLMGRWSKLAGRQFLDWLALPSGLNWLDCGCGNGAFTEEIACRAEPASVKGIDPSEAQIAFAKTRRTTLPVDFLVGDAQSLPIEDAGVDAAVMALSISFIPDPAKALSELFRVTRPGGTVASYMWDLKGHGVPLSPFYRGLREMGFTPPQPPSVEISDLESAKALWTETGLRDVVADVIRVQIEFIDFEDFWQSNTLPAGPHAKFVNDLTPAQKVELRQILNKSLPTGADGSIAYYSVANAVKGVKPA